MKSRFRHGGFAVAALLFAISSAHALARFAGKQEMARKADAIAIVEIATPRAIKVTPAQGWTYSQAAEAKVLETVKGSVKGNITLLGHENFICAQCNWTQGKYLVFLRKNEAGWTGANWHLSSWKVTGENVEWTKTDEPFGKKENRPLKNVLEEVRSLMKP